MMQCVTRSENMSIILSSISRHKRKDRSSRSRSKSPQHKRFETFLLLCTCEEGVGDEGTKTLHPIASIREHWY